MDCMNYFKEKAIPHSSLVDFAVGLYPRACYSIVMQPKLKISRKFTKEKKVI